MGSGLAWKATMKRRSLSRSASSARVRSVMSVGALARIHPEAELDRSAAQDLLPAVAGGGQECVVGVADAAVAHAGEAQDRGAEPENRAELFPEARVRWHPGQYDGRGRRLASRPRAAARVGCIIGADADPPRRRP